MQRLSTCVILNIIVGKLNRIFVFVELLINSNDIQFDISVVIVDKVIFGFVYDDSENNIEGVLGTP